MDQTEKAVDYLFAGLVFLPLFFLPCGTYPSLFNDPISTDNGKISETEKDDVRIYKGIPYAAPPAIELR